MHARRPVAVQPSRDVSAEFLDFPRSHPAQNRPGKSETITPGKPFFATAPLSKKSWNSSANAGRLPMIRLVAFAIILLALVGGMIAAVRLVRKKR